jgi:regulator of protease activity HflC (stomatin/prohibitin superfamily)
MGCCYTIPQSEVGITETWGKFNSVVRPGFHFINPLSTELAGRMSLRVKELKVKIESKTKDNVFVHSDISVQYKILESAIFKAYYELTDAEKQLESYVFNNVRGQIPHYLLDELFLAKEEMAATLKQDLEHEMNQFGYSIVQTLITDIDPADVVKVAMNDINAAQRTRVAATDKAEAEKIQVIKAAEAEAESKRLSGVGLAEQRKAVVSGLHESIEVFADNRNITRKEVLELLLMNQYFDTLTHMSHTSKTTTVFVSHTPDAVGTISEQLRSGLLAAKQLKKVE